MELEKQVCSLDLAKRLKELGVKQESYFHWYQGPQAEWHLGDTAEMMNGAVDVGHTTAPQFVCASAFTVAEFGEMLPFFLHERNVFVGQLMSWKNPHEWSVSYGTMKHIFHNEKMLTEADGRAKMLIYLLENQLISGGSDERQDNPAATRR